MQNIFLIVICKLTVMYMVLASGNVHATVGITEKIRNNTIYCSNIDETVMGNAANVNFYTTETVKIPLREDNLVNNKQVNLYRAGYTDLTAIFRECRRKIVAQNASSSTKQNYVRISENDSNLVNIEEAQYESKSVPLRDHEVSYPYPFTDYTQPRFCVDFSPLSTYSKPHRRFARNLKSVAVNYETNFGHERGKSATARKSTNAFPRGKRRGPSRSSSFEESFASPDRWNKTLLLPKLLQLSRVARNTDETKLPSATQSLKLRRILRSNPVPKKRNSFVKKRRKRRVRRRRVRNARIKRDDDKKATAYIDALKLLDATTSSQDSKKRTTHGPAMLIWVPDTSTPRVIEQTTKYSSTPYKKSTSRRETHATQKGAVATLLTTISKARFITVRITMPPTVSELITDTDTTTATTTPLPTKISKTTMAATVVAASTSVASTAATTEAATSPLEAISETTGELVSITPGTTMQPPIATTMETVTEETTTVTTPLPVTTGEGAVASRTTLTKSTATTSVLLTTNETGTTVEMITKESSVTTSYAGTSKGTTTVSVATSIGTTMSPTTETIVATTETAAKTVATTTSQLVSTTETSVIAISTELTTIATEIPTETTSVSVPSTMSTTVLVTESATPTTEPSTVSTTAKSTTELKMATVETTTESVTPVTEGLTTVSFTTTTEPYVLPTTTIRSTSPVSTTVSKITTLSPKTKTTRSIETSELTTPFETTLRVTEHVTATKTKEQEYDEETVATTTPVGKTTPKATSTTLSTTKTTVVAKTTKRPSHTANITATGETPTSAESTTSPIATPATESTITESTAVTTESSSAQTPSSTTESVSTEGPSSTIESTTGTSTSVTKSAPATTTSKGTTTGQTTVESTAIETPSATTESPFSTTKISVSESTPRTTEVIVLESTERTTEIIVLGSTLGATENTAIESPSSITETSSTETSSTETSSTETTSTSTEGATTESLSVTTESTSSGIPSTVTEGTTIESTSTESASSPIPSTVTEGTTTERIESTTESTTVESTSTQSPPTTIESTITESTETPIQITENVTTLTASLSTESSTMRTSLSTTETVESTIANTTETPSVTTEWPATTTESTTVTGIIPITITSEVTAETTPSEEKQTSAITEVTITTTEVSPKEGEATSETAFATPIDTTFTTVSLSVEHPDITETVTGEEMTVSTTIAIDATTESIIAVAETTLPITVATEATESTLPTIATLSVTTETTLHTTVPPQEITMATFATKESLATTEATVAGSTEETYETETMHHDEYGTEETYDEDEDESTDILSPQWRDYEEESVTTKSIMETTEKEIIKIEVTIVTEETNLTTPSVTVPHIVSTEENETITLATESMGTEATLEDHFTFTTIVYTLPSTAELTPEFLPVDYSEGSENIGEFEATATTSATDASIRHEFTTFHSKVTTDQEQKDIRHEGLREELRKKLKELEGTEREILEREKQLQKEEEDWELEKSKLMQDIMGRNKQRKGTSCGTVSSPGVSPSGRGTTSSIASSARATTPATTTKDMLEQEIRELEETLSQKEKKILEKKNNLLERERRLQRDKEEFKKKMEEMEGRLEKGEDIEEVLRATGTSFEGTTRTTPAFSERPPTDRTTFEIRESTLAEVKRTTTVRRIITDEPGAEGHDGGCATKVCLDVLKKKPPEHISADLVTERLCLPFIPGKFREKGKNKEKRTKVDELRLKEHEWNEGPLEKDRETQQTGTIDNENEEKRSLSEWNRFRRGIGVEEKLHPERRVKNVVATGEEAVWQRGNHRYQCMDNSMTTKAMEVSENDYRGRYNRMYKVRDILRVSGDDGEIRFEGRGEGNDGQYDFLDQIEEDLIEGVDTFPGATTSSLNNEMKPISEDGDHPVSVNMDGDVLREQGRGNASSSEDDESDEKKKTRRVRTRQTPGPEWPTEALTAFHVGGTRTWTIEYPGQGSAEDEVNFMEDLENMEKQSLESTEYYHVVPNIEEERLQQGKHI